MKYDAFISYSHAADGRLAPALQRLLHKLAKPWYQMRALEVFRDQTDLSASPHLWESIENVLRASEHFLLLASPEAAASKWVGKELEYWLDHKSPETLLLVVTDGELAWDEDRGDFDWSATTVIPQRLSGVFEMEPLYVDLREVRTDADLSIENPRFRERLLPLAAALHKTTVGNMVGEEVRQHRKTVRIRNAAISTLILLSVIASVAALVAFDQKKLADARFHQARAGELAARAALVEDRDPTLSFRLAEASLRFGATAQARAAIFRNFFGVARAPFYEVVLLRESITVAKFSEDHSYLALSTGQAVELRDRHGQLLRTLEHSSRVVDLALSADSRRIGALGEDGTARIWTRDGEGVESIGPDVSTLRPGGMTLSPGGRYLLLDEGIFDPYLRDLRSRSGRLIRTQATLNSQVLYGHYVRFSPDERYLAFCLTDESTFLYDLQAGEGKRIDGIGNPTAAAFSDDGRWLLIGTQDGIESYDLVARRLSGVHANVGPDNPVRVVEFVDGEISFGSEVVDGFFAVGYQDGSVRWVDPSLTRLRSILTGMSAVERVEAGPGTGWLLTSSEDGVVRIWDFNGAPRHSLKGHTGRILDVSYLPPQDTALTVSADGTVRRWRLGAAPYWTFDENAGGPLQIAPYFTADAERVVAPGADDVQKVFDVSGRLIESQPKPEYREPPHDVTPEGISQPLHEIDAPELAALPGVGELTPFREELVAALGEAFSPGATHVRISPENRYLLFCRMDFVTNSYFGNFVVLPVDLVEILSLVDERRLFGPVWALDDASRARFGLSETVPTLGERIRHLARGLAGR